MRSKNRLTLFRIPSFSLAEKFNFSEVISDRDRKLWMKIINNKDNALQEFLPNKLNRPLRQRGHEFELPIIRTERYERLL